MPLLSILATLVTFIKKKDKIIWNNKTKVTKLAAERNGAMK